jgi:phosphonate transport system substrate-binding protein
LILIDPDAENELWFTSVEPGSIEDYEPVMDVVNTLGIEFEDIG